ncbi:MAG TPA: transaldolase family protein, partial [Steroidobacteraceae bacterium]
MSRPPPNPLLELRKLGESAWLDGISRTMIEDGSLAALIKDDGIAGLTSNPAIFANSITTDARYGAAIARLLPTEPTSVGVYEDLALKDL